jgi:hypothetical protein
MNPNPYAPPNAPLVSGYPAGPLTPQRVAEIQKEIKTNNLLSFALGIPGIGLQVLGNTMGGMLGRLVSFAGTALLIGGLVFYARLRGRSPFFSLFGLLSCLGLLILYFMPKYCLNCHTQASYSKKQCATCGAPLGM